MTLDPTTQPVVRTFTVHSAGARDVLARYRAALGDQWRLVQDIDEVDSGAYRAEWESAYHWLRVIAAGEPARVAVEYRTKDAAPEVMAVLTRLLADRPPPVSSQSR